MKVRVGIVGLGYWGPNLVRNFYSQENCEVVYLCDLDKRSLDRIKKQFPAITTTQSFKDLLNAQEVDAIVIATPSNTHVSLVTQALKKGKHVFVEKPFTLSVKEADAVVRINQKMKRIIMVGHTYEYHPAIIKLKEYITQKDLGDLFYIYASRTNLGKVREETNALWNLAPHDISILNYILDMKPISVSAFGQPYLQKKHEDVVFIHLRYPENIIAHVHVSWLDPSKERKLTVVGSKKMVVFDDLDNESAVRVYDKGFIKQVSDKGERMYREFSLKLHHGDVHIPYISSKEPLYEECFHFIQSILTKKRPKSDEHNGRAVVSVLEAAQNSLEKGGKWIKPH